MTHTFITLTCRFVCANLAGKCRRAVILEHFGEDATAATCEGVCCDVCDTQPKMANAQNEISLVLKTVRDLPGYGEVKVSANISARNTLITFLFILALHFSLLKFCEGRKQLPKLHLPAASLERAHH